MEGGDHVPQLPSASPSDGAAAVDFDDLLDQLLYQYGDSSFPEVSTPPLARRRSPPPAALIVSADVTIAATAATTPAANASCCVQTGSASTSFDDWRLLEEPLPDDTGWFKVASPSPNSLQPSPPPPDFCSSWCTPVPTGTTPAANESWSFDMDGTSQASVKERLNQALSYIREMQRDGDVLVQLWEPGSIGGLLVLSTRGHQFTLDHRSDSLIKFREVSIENKSLFMSELPGRVFSSRLPEWSPDVRYCTTDKEPRVIHAKSLGIKGTMGIPVFEMGSYKSCLGVIELLVTRQKFDVTSELDTICSALQAVNLRSTEVSSIPRIMVGDLQQNMEVCVDKDTWQPVFEVFGTWILEDEQEEEVAGEASSQQQQQSVIAKAGGQRQQGKRPRSVASTSLNPPKSRTSKIWEHYKEVSPVLAECRRCYKMLNADSKNGTSRLWRHLESHLSNGTEVSNGFSKSEKNNDGPIALRNCENEVALAASQARVAAGKSTEATAKATAAAHAAAVCASASSTALGGAYSTTANVLGEYLEFKKDQSSMTLEDLKEKKRREEEFSVANCVAALEAMDDLTDEQKADALELFKCELNRQIFIKTKNPNVRRIWLMKRIAP